MGANDAAEMLEEAKAEVVRLEHRAHELEQAIELAHASLNDGGDDTLPDRIDAALTALGRVR